MKNIIPLTLLLAGLAFFGRSHAQTPAELEPYITFIKEQKLSAKDYIISLFDDYDIVIFCERTHDEMTQYELLTDIMADERFQKKVGDVFMEMGGSNFDAEINNYLFADNLTKEQSTQSALEIQRNMCWYPLWQRYNYHYLLTSLYDINQSLPKEEKIKLHPTDIAIDWESIVTLDDVKKKIVSREIQSSRDSVIAANIITYISQNEASDTERKKYFIILNTAHSVKGTWVLGNTKRKSTASYVFEKFDDRVANVLLNYESLLNMFSTSMGLPETLPIIDGKLDASFEYLGIESLGFDIIGSPIEHYQFENLIMSDSTLTNNDVFTGYVFYKSFPKHELVNGVPGIVDLGFKRELIRRQTLWDSLWNYTRSEKEMDDYIEAFNILKKKSSEGLSGYWQKVMYWIGGGKRIVAYYTTAESIDEVIAFITDERAKGNKSEYNVMESGINEFGYYLMRSGKDNDALAIFKLNTQLYPNGENTYDSYGECLLKLGRTEEALEAYKKSLELNPDNGRAQKLLEVSNLNQN